MTTPTDTEKLAQALRRALKWASCPDEPVYYIRHEYKDDMVFARAVLEAHKSRAQPDRRPDGYAYRYMHWDRGTIIRFSNGEEINGSKPLAAIPYYFDEPPAQPASVPDPHVIAEKVWETLDRQSCPGHWQTVAYEAVVDALGKAQPASVADGWQPIDTAPRDGTLVIIAGGELQRPVFAWWTARNYWAGDQRGPYEPIPYEPAYWMPAPQPAKESE